MYGKVKNASPKDDFLVTRRRCLRLLNRGAGVSAQVQVLKFHSLGSGFKMF